MLQHTELSHDLEIFAYYLSLPYIVTVAVSIVPLVLKIGGGEDDCEFDCDVVAVEGGVVAVVGAAVVGGGVVTVGSSERVVRKKE